MAVLAAHLAAGTAASETLTVALMAVPCTAARTPMYWITQISTFAILMLAANTAYADFPRLSSIIARDGYLPRQLSNRGDRLVFSNGILVLSCVAGVLIVGVQRQDRPADPALCRRRLHRVHPVPGGHGGAPLAIA